MKTQKSKPPFIRSQRFSLLHAQSDPKWYLEPSRFREARWHAFKTKKERQKIDGLSARHEQWLDAWKPVSRNELFLSHRLHRLCLTIDGGIGKTTNLKWCEANGYLEGANGSSRSNLFLYVHFSELPLSVEHYLEPYEVIHSGVTLKKQGALVELLFERFREANKPVTPNGIQAYLKRLIRRGKVTFLVDGLDQTRGKLSNSQSTNPKVTALASFMRTLANACGFVVAGRPHAVIAYWDDLFANDHWQFAMIDGFNEKQRKLYLGEKFEKVKKLDAESLSIPRMLEAIRQYIPEEKLETIETTSELYCEVIDHTWEMDKPTEASRRKLSKNRALQLLSCFAFEMFRDGDNWEGVSRTNRQAFLDHIWESRFRELGFSDPFDAEQRERFDAEVIALGETNSLIDYCLLDGDEQLTDIYFRDTTLQEFFVAYWLAHFAPAADSELIGRIPYLPDVEQANRENLYRIWRFLAEMPQPQPMVWLRSIEPLFRPQPKSGRRSCEIMYRAYRYLDAYGRSSKKGFFDPPEHVTLAQTILRAFHDEFTVGILGGQQGEKKKKVAERFVGTFRPIPPDFKGPHDLRFTAGTSPELQKRRDVHVLFPEPLIDVQLSSRFELSAYPTRNVEYELFESSHTRKFTDEYSENELDDHPVAVNWYQATMFCKWLNRWEPMRKSSVTRYKLPHELEWEFAARAGTTTLRYFCSDALTYAKVHAELSKYANFENSSISRVGSFRGNPWGLFDVYGNVWEWTANSSSRDARETLEADDYLATSRVCRGGAWDFPPSAVRSSVRGGLHPAVHVNFIGFRVSRALENS